VSEAFAQIELIVKRIACVDRVDPEMKLLGRAPKRERLTLRHLASVAERGVWFDPWQTSD
jgi:hypothetical protein